MLVMTFLANALGRTGARDEAHQLADETLALGKAALPADAPLLIRTQAIAATLASDAGDQAGALALLESALQAARRAVGADGLLVGEVANHLANLLYKLERTDEGIVAGREALRVNDLRQGRGSQQRVFARGLLAKLRFRDGDLAEGAQRFDEAHADARATYGGGRVVWAQFAADAARTMDAAGRRADGVAILESALTTLTAASYDPEGIAEVQFALATRLPRRDVRARQLATAALATCAAHTRPAIEAWLAKAPPPTPR